MGSTFGESIGFIGNMTFTSTKVGASSEAETSVPLYHMTVAQAEGGCVDFHLRPTFYCLHMNDDGE